MARPMRGETPPRTRFWAKDRVNPRQGVWVAEFAGKRWELRKRPRGPGDTPGAGWFLTGTDPDGTVTVEAWMGSRVTKAQPLAEQWITSPAERDQVRAGAV